MKYAKVISGIVVIIILCSFSSCGFRRAVEHNDLKLYFTEHQTEFEYIGKSFCDNFEVMEEYERLAVSLNQSNDLAVNAYGNDGREKTAPLLSNIQKSTCKQLLDLMKAFFADGDFYKGYEFGKAGMDISIEFYDNSVVVSITLVDTKSGSNCGYFFSDDGKVRSKKNIANYLEELDSGWYSYEVFFLTSDEND